MGFPVYSGRRQKKKRKGVDKSVEKSVKLLERQQNLLFQT